MMNKRDELGSEQLINWPVAVSKLQNREDLLQELTLIFLQEVEDICERIADSLAKKKFEPLRRGAHTLKGSAGIFCANSTVNLAGRLEMAAQAEDIDKCESEWGKLKELLPVLRESLLKASGETAT